MALDCGSYQQSRLHPRTARELAHIDRLRGNAQPAATMLITVDEKVGNGGSGLLVHSLLALTPEGQVPGLGTQHVWARPPGPTHKRTETRAQRQARPDKESEVWPRLLEAVGT